MPTIPRAQQMGLGDQTAQVTRGVVSVPTIDQSGARMAADALDKVGGQLREFGQRLHQAEVDRSVAEANIGATNDLDKLKRRLAESQADPTTYETTYAEESGRIIEAWGKKVPGGGRDMWMQRAREGQLRDTIEVRNLTRQRQLEGEQAKGIAIFENIKDRAGDASLSPAAYGEMQMQGRQLVADQLARGIITKDVAQKYLVELDNAQVTDMATRWTDNVAALAEQGLFDIAEGTLAEGTKGGIPKAFVEDAKASISRARSRIEKERNERLNINDANFQVDVMAGRKGYRHVDEAIARGELDPSRRDTLYRVVREEEDRRRREAEESKLSAAERAAIENRSKDIKFVFNSMAEMDPARFMGGKEAWSEQHSAYYDLMTPADQRAVDEQVQKMRVDGPKVGPTNAVERALLDEAKRVVPEWRIGSDADPKNLPADSIPFSGVLRKVAEELSPTLGGKDLTVPQARDAVARALRQYQPDKWMGLPTNERDAWMDRTGAANPYDEGANIRNEIRAEFVRMKRREPTKAELDAEYARVVGD